MTSDFGNKSTCSWIASTIALISAEPFPTSIRGQCNGLISAFAKVGATAGTEVSRDMRPRIPRRS